MQLKVLPDPTIDPAKGADVSHTGTGTIVVTIENQDGDTATLTVPAGQTVHWTPKAGWTAATFTAIGCEEVFRYIAGAAEQD